LAVVRSTRWVSISGVPALSLGLGVACENGRERERLAFVGRGLAALSRVVREADD
jgi:hypothetical protein